MKKLILFTLVLFFFCSSLSAVNVTWLGGTGSWLDPTKWSTGAVPGQNDDVMIYSGTVNLTGPLGTRVGAETIYLSNSASLYIGTSTILEVSDQQAYRAIDAYGAITIDGTLVVEDMDNGEGIKNRSTLTINTGGVLKIRHTYSAALSNLNTVYNAGSIELGPDVNVGLIMYGNSVFTNSEQGRLTISDHNFWGINMTGSGSLFVNSGELGITNGSQGILVSAGIFYNDYEGNVEIYGTGNGIYFLSSPQFINNGKLSMKTGGSGIYFSNTSTGAVFGNNNSGEIDIISTNGPAICMATSNSSFLNHGILSAKTNMNSTVLSNYSSDFVNSACAQMTLRGQIRNYATGNIQNDGWMYVSSATLSTNTGVINNSGVLEDASSSLTGLVTNNRVITRTAQGPLGNGWPVPNFLVVNNWTGFTVIGVYTSLACTTSAGNYNPANNTFLPNAAGAGKTSVYFKIRKNGDLCSSVFRVKILPAPSPVAPPNNPTEIADASMQQMNTAARLYPNPSSGAFQLEIPEALPGDCDILIFNTLGQLVHQQQNDFSASPTLSVNAAEKWPPGVYSVKISQNGQPIWQSRLALTR